MMELCNYVNACFKAQVTVLDIMDAAADFSAIRELIVSKGDPLCGQAAFWIDRRDWT